jgi:hypothetical protein
VIALRNAYVARIATLPHVRTAVAHDEDVNEAELKRIGSKATPVVYVVCLGTDDAEFSGETEAPHRFAAVVATDRSAAAREEDIASKGDLAGAIALRVAYDLITGAAPTASGGGDLTSGPATNVRTRNESSSELARAGYSVWVVTWRVLAPITPDDVELVTRPLHAIHTSYTTPGSGVGADGTVESATLTSFVEDEEEEEP